MKFYNENSSEINEKAVDLEREATKIIHTLRRIHGQAQKNAYGLVHDEPIFRDHQCRK